MSAGESNQDDPYPSLGTSIEVGFADGTRSWTESADVVELLSEVLTAAGVQFEANAQGIALHLHDGWILEPDIRGFEPSERGGVKTTTVVIARHLEIAPGGLFEYQHARGEDLQGAFRNGFSNWLQRDYQVLRDALTDTPEHCTAMQYEAAGHTIRILLGPPAYFARNPDSAAVAEPHPFCPCCLFTQGLAVFRQLFEADGLIGLRLFCARDDQGHTSADCRVNGYDWEPGRETLAAYASSWPDRGFEFRKQYVLIQRVPAALR